MAKLTPAMRQYMDVKNDYPDCIILFRMGDFYETFYEDAVALSEAVSITLTKRGKSSDGSAIPLAGIPYHALDNYLGKLVRQGFKVAICEQLEDPKQAKGVVKRGVTRIVTPGTVIEENLLDQKKNNYIVSVYFGEMPKIGLAAVDLSTGAFRATSVDRQNIVDEIAKYAPAEVIVPMSCEDTECSRALRKYYINTFSDRHFLPEQAKKVLLAHFRVNSVASLGIGGMGSMESGPAGAADADTSSLSAAGALISYLKETQKTTIDYINRIAYYTNSEFMQLDHITVRNLEILGNIHGKGKSLLSVIDFTCTSMGSRMLRSWMVNPLLDTALINRRLDSVQELVSDTVLRSQLVEQLSYLGDIERLLSRISYGNGNARDLVSLKSSISVIPQVKQALACTGSAYLAELKEMDEIKGLFSLLKSSVSDEPPASVREGHMIKRGHDKELDELHDIVKDSRRFLSELEAKEREKTGIRSLKIGFNRVFGYYFEVTKPNLASIPHGYIRKQTTVNAERFITEELKESEEKILNAQDRINDIEYRLFCGLVEKVKGYTKELQATARSISELDCLCSFAQAALRNSYTRPHVDTGYRLCLKESRHPVIESIEEEFIPNDVQMDEGSRTMIITGPNMAGKSTFMRQVALNVLLAQIGCFVACASADIGIVDRIFTRVGAHDDLSHGQSTFMVEMNEVSMILNNATADSLIVMDEIGRGTSTFDGVAIAWSVAEYINSRIRAKTMFATHYHVLTGLSKDDGIKNYNVAVREDADNIIFLRKIVKGGTDKSYGIHVARLSGMPESVVERAKTVQEMLYRQDEMRTRIGGRTKESHLTDLNSWLS
ncbi:DNA mismatch repair protein MutS [Candidatus Woesearchaeota archaeon]|nr:DNA mismatch repair protein MutS [Candidatus Woesearchaeota archaeon]